MAYIGNVPAAAADNNFRILNDIKTFTLTFDGSSASVVSVDNDTITQANHIFITGQRVTYTDGGGTAIGGLTDDTAFFIIKDSKDTIKLATNASNAANGTAINLTGLGVGASHTLNVAFDGVNTKFTATTGAGNEKVKLSKAAQLQISLDGVIQQPQDTAAPTSGFGIQTGSGIVFSSAPSADTVFWGNVLADSIASFDVADNDVDTFTGDGSTTDFNLSKSPPNSQNVLVTIDGVVQYPSDTSNTRSYNIVEQEIRFVSAPGNGTVIQVRHIGFGGATSSAVTGFYGRTGNAALLTSDNINVGNVNSSGVITATSFVGSGANLTGIDTTSLKDTGGNVRIEAIGTGATVTDTLFANQLSVAGITTLHASGIGTVIAGVGVTALLVQGNARVTGIMSVGEGTIVLDPNNDMIEIGDASISRHSGGDLQAMRSGEYSPFRASDLLIDANTVIDNNQNLNVTGIATATTFNGTSSVVVGDSFLKSNSVGIGSTTTNVGVNTALGTLILNTTTGQLQAYGPEGWSNVKTLTFSGIEATGGLTNEYESGGSYYKSHIFTSSGTFEVTSIGDYPAEVEVLVVGGGGGGGGANGGGWAGGGGGAGGYRTNPAFTVTASTNYPITIGAGGAGGGGENVGSNSLGTPGNNGSSTVAFSITSDGGGYGGRGNFNSTKGAGGPGASGGGGGQSSPAGTPGGTGNTPPTSPPQGNDGSPGNTGGGPYWAGGGGGAGGAGGPGSPAAGAGIANSISGITTTYAQGGVGSASNGALIPADTGLQGHGWGGNGGGNTSAAGGSGGSGTVVVKYRIGGSQTGGTAKATGGFITFAGGQTIHRFNSSGTFTITDSSLTSVDYLVVAGGGGGGAVRGGGGGAGGMLTGSSFPVNPSPGTYAIAVGGGGSGYRSNPGPAGIQGQDGYPSVFSTITAWGGGGGSGNSPSQGGRPGGSGGGANDNNASAFGVGNRETGTTNPAPQQGNDGGSANGAPLYGAGGGGGAGGAGNPGRPSNDGAGGPGAASAITGTSTYYAGGGAGGSYGDGAPGGQGGGGASNPGVNTNGNPGTLNTGGGGGGASESNGPSLYGGHGGSGIVIISYPT